MLGDYLILNLCKDLGKKGEIRDRIVRRKQV